MVLGIHVDHENKIYLGGLYDGLKIYNPESNSIEQSGDIKLLLNAELRFPLYKFIKAAVFLDAGNVWLR